MRHLYLTDSIVWGTHQELVCFRTTHMTWDVLISAGPCLSLSSLFSLFLLLFFMSVPAVLSRMDFVIVLFFLVRGDAALVGASKMQMFKQAEDISKDVFSSSSVATRRRGVSALDIHLVPVQTDTLLVVVVVCRHCVRHVLASNCSHIHRSDTISKRSQAVRAKRLHRRRARSVQFKQHQLHRRLQSVQEETREVHQLRVRRRTNVKQVDTHTR